MENKALNINLNEISYKKVVGKCGSNKVFEIGTVGGLNLIIVAKATPEVAGVASHRAISRYIASKKNPDIVYTELSKSLDSFNPNDHKALVAKYEAYTDQVRKLQKL